MASGHLLKFYLHEEVNSTSRNSKYITGPYERTLHLKHACCDIFVMKNIIADCNAV